jgi:hypothetical protein
MPDDKRKPSPPPQKKTEHIPPSRPSDWRDKRPFPSYDRDTVPPSGKKDSNRASGLSQSNYYYREEVFSVCRLKVNALS